MDLLNKKLRIAVDSGMVLLLPFLYYIYARFPIFMVQAFQKMSKNINQIYCIHWGIIGVLGIVRVFTWKDTIISMLPMTISSFVILFISSIAAERYQNWEESWNYV